MSQILRVLVSTALAQGDPPTARTPRRSSKAMAANNAIARHRYVSESELDGKTTNTEIGILEVWSKAADGWKLLARQGYKLPA